MTQKTTTPAATDEPPKNTPSKTKELDKKTKQALQLRLDEMRRSALAIDSATRFDHVIALSGFLFDEYYQPLEVAEAEIQSAERALAKKREERELSDTRLLDIPEYLSTPPEQGEPDDE